MLPHCPPGAPGAGRERAPTVLPPQVQGVFLTAIQAKNFRPRHPAAPHTHNITHAAYRNRLESSTASTILAVTDADAASEMTVRPRPRDDAGISEIAALFLGAAEVKEVIGERLEVATASMRGSVAPHASVEHLQCGGPKRGREEDKPTATTLPEDADRNKKKKKKKKKKKRNTPATFVPHKYIDLFWLVTTDLQRVDWNKMSIARWKDAYKNEWEGKKEDPRGVQFSEHWWRKYRSLLARDVPGLAARMKVEPEPNSESDRESESERWPERTLGKAPRKEKEQRLAPEQTRARARARAGSLKSEEGQARQPTSTPRASASTSTSAIFREKNGSPSPSKLPEIAASTRDGGAWTVDIASRSGSCKVGMALYPGDTTASQRGADSHKQRGEATTEGGLCPTHPPTALTRGGAAVYRTALNRSCKSSPSQPTATGTPEALAAAPSSPALPSRAPGPTMPSSLIAALTDTAPLPSVRCGSLSTRIEPASKVVTSPSRVKTTGKTCTTSSRAGNIAGTKATTSASTATLGAKATCKATAGRTAQPVPAPPIPPPTIDDLARALVHPSGGGILSGRWTLWSMKNDDMGTARWEQEYEPPTKPKANIIGGTIYPPPPSSDNKRPMGVLFIISGTRRSVTILCSRPSPNAVGTDGAEYIAPSPLAEWGKWDENRNPLGSLQITLWTHCSLYLGEEPGVLWTPITGIIPRPGTPDLHRLSTVHGLDPDKLSDLVRRLDPDPDPGP